jgi:hypothetical protein
MPVYLNALEKRTPQNRKSLRAGHDCHYENRRSDRKRNLPVSTAIPPGR